jgi:hypothetical protein
VDDPPLFDLRSAALATVGIRASLNPGVGPLAPARLGGSDAHDAQIGEWSRRRLETMDRRFAKAMALARPRSRSCIIDGEAVACGDDGGGSGRSH